MSSIREGLPRRPRLFFVFVNGGMGLFFLAVGLNRPTIANMRTIDLVHLLATGACLGVALVTLVLYLVIRRKA